MVGRLQQFEDFSEFWQYQLGEGGRTILTVIFSLVFALLFYEKIEKSRIDR